ncbi:fumarylacetoacetate hydrolase family protein [Methanobacterium sp. 42_16]|jgi:2-keto-4-pentenoate hydratase/2-oxohepta-3-ene-1,7-dioic acid hydratase in catechol pathway|uniref:fumarylacetoacetate hydrolase family protein n=1 Tax=Methanobacterium sp. 42_16 TaxID=1641383 RepID=UPI0007469BF3|nr:fumarylacetoacetate hydrolase family protein [Methanobacterium sp. 42_16]KUK74705.1 MAG: Ureidoglycolate lyase [Methanobacterium sp. 42_16]MDD4809928.1 fumarylacetoacetate hydrolase family protein [Methanobacterium formicicum]
MRLIRFKTGTEEKNGVVVNGGLVEIPHSLLEASQAPFGDLERKDFYSLDDVNILPPVQPSKVVCVGLNYRDHAQELNMDLPEEPILFIKPPTTVIGPDNPIIYPPQCHQLDYEAELAVVIGRETRFTSKNDARDHIAGYTILNDVTARDLQRKDGQWTRAKSFDTFCPIGPWIETDMDPSHQDISLKLNGEVKQNSNTENMIFSVEELVEFISHIMTLNQGDIIATGTPPGVGSMNVEDIVEVKIEGIGTLSNKIKGY